MEPLNNKLLQFNSVARFNKSELLDLFDHLVAHYGEQDNEEGFSEVKRKVVLSLCEKFRSELEKKEIPPVIYPWFYDYAITNDSIALSLQKCNDIELDDNGEISSTSYTVEKYALIEVKCNYMTVEQYAELHEVTTTTVRQWIRRGKLRTAKKEGRDWLIPALADKPKRGFERVTYRWESLSSDILSTFPYLSKTKCVHICQDDEDKKDFYAITGLFGEGNYQKVKLSAKEREQLEITLVAAPEVDVEEEFNGGFVPTKQSL